MHQVSSLMRTPVSDYEERAVEGLELPLVLDKLRCILLR